MLHDFVTANRAEIIARCRAKMSTRPVPRPTDVELERGVPLFLDQLADTLRLALAVNPEITTTAAAHAAGLLHDGFTIAQVVHNYGGICQTITQMAGESELPITTTEFRTLNSCLDEAIAGAVTEYSRVREYEGTERLGHLAHELRNLLNSAVLSYQMLKSGSVGISGSTGAVLGRSLAGLQGLVDRELAEVRLSAGLHHRESVVVREFIEDVEAAATLEANARGLEFSVMSVSDDVTVHVDRAILASVVANLLQNAFKFTRGGGACLAAGSRNRRSRAHRRRRSMRRTAAGKGDGAVRSVRTARHRPNGIGPRALGVRTRCARERRRNPRA